MPNLKWLIIASTNHDVHLDLYLLCIVDKVM
jgi:hypothetical protein